MTGNVYHGPFNGFRALQRKQMPCPRNGDHLGIPENLCGEMSGYLKWHDTVFGTVDYSRGNVVFRRGNMVEHHGEPCGKITV